MIELELPYPPSVNNYKRPGRIITTKSGKIYQTRVNTSRTKRFFWEVHMIVRAYALKSLYELPISSDVDLQIDVYPTDGRKRDLDNILKVLLDSLMSSGLIEDDSQVSRLLVTRCATLKGNGKLTVRITPYVSIPE